MGSLFGTRGLAGTWNAPTPRWRTPLGCVECHRDPRVVPSALCESCLRAEVRAIGRLVRDWQRTRELISIPRYRTRPAPPELPTQAELYPSEDLHRANPPDGPIPGTG